MKRLRVGAWSTYTRSGIQIGYCNASERQRLLHYNDRLT